MEYFLIAFVGFLAGAFCLFVLSEQKRKAAENLSRRAKEVLLRIDHVQSKEAQIAEQEMLLLIAQEHFESQKAAQIAEQESLLSAAWKEFESAKITQTAEQELRLSNAWKEFESQKIAYQELQQENSILKRDLSNLAVNLRKLSLDGVVTRQTQAEIDHKVQELGARYLKENVKWIGNSLNPNNFANCKQRLLDVIERCRGIGFEISTEQEQVLLDDLRSEYERVVRAAFEREEQARIKAQIREEQQREREIQRELERVERERAVLEAALAKALAEAEDQHSAEIENLRARLEQAEANKRAISQAQLTKAGFVYVISNIGSFGEGVFKIGMTRRLVPQERVRELGDASVPFPFDVHMMISCENAPALENALHRRFLKQQINKTNPRKEFFKTDIDSIVATVKEHHGEVDYIADAEALQYRQSLTMSDEDQEFIEHVFEELGIEDEPEGGDDA